MNSGTLEVRSSTISGNFGPDGGGIANTNGAIALLLDTVIENNTSAGEGGVVWNVEKFVMKRSLVTGSATDMQGGNIFQRSEADLKLFNTL